MLIGILSDTHGRAEIAATAIGVLRSRGAQYYLHCGDVGDEAVLDQLAGLPAAFVWGNTDWDRLPLERYAETLGITCYGSLGDLTLGGKRLALLHGDDSRTLHRLLEVQEFDYLLHGHTHEKRLERIGRTLVINPGALHRAKEKTVALLETDNDVVEFLTVG